MATDIKKFQLTQIDLLPMFRKIKTGKQDNKGNDLCFGDTVNFTDREDGKYVVSYRYGNVCLKQPFTAHTIGISDYSRVELVDECSAFQDYTMIGYTNDPVYDQIKELEHRLLPS